MFYFIKIALTKSKLSLHYWIKVTFQGAQTAKWTIYNYIDYTFLRTLFFWFQNVRVLYFLAFEIHHAHASSGVIGVEIKVVRSTVLISVESTCPKVHDTTKVMTQGLSCKQTDRQIVQKQYAPVIWPRSIKVSE